MTSDKPPPNPYFEPSHATQPEPPPRQTGSKPAGTAHRIAGGLMIVNGILALLEVSLVPHAGSGPSPVMGVVPAVIDILIGIALLSGNGALVTFAIVRAVLGMTAGAALRMEEGAWVIAYQVLLCGAMLGLLVGKAGRLRTSIAASAVGALIVLEVIGLSAISTGSNPLGPLLAALNGTIESAPAEHVSGRTAPYELTFPNKSWYPRKQESVARENPLADRWFVRPDKDAHILVVAEEAKGSPLPIDAYVDTVLKGLRADSPTMEVYSREPWPAFPERGRLVKVRDRKTGTVIERRYAFVTVFGRAYYLVGLASPLVMPAVEAEMQAIFDSLKLPEAVLNALPDDVDPTPIGKIEGTKIAYSILSPGPNWHLRKAEVVARENAIIDRWLSHSEKNAHVLVIAEEVAAGVLVLPLYVDAIVESVKKGASRFEVVSREPWAKFPSEGVRLRISMARSGTDLEYEYGLYVKGLRAFQVVGFSSKGGFAAAQPDLERAIDSFQPPP